MVPRKTWVSENFGKISKSFLIKSRSLVFAWFVFTFFESRNFLPKSLGLGFLTRISASRQVSDFTIRHPLYSKDFWPLAVWKSGILNISEFLIVLVETADLFTSFERGYPTTVSS